MCGVEIKVTRNRFLAGAANFMVMSINSTAINSTAINSTAINSMIIELMAV
jgi:hypothetical protein